MPELLPFLKELSSASGLSGYETPAANIIAERWRPLVDQLGTSRLGSLHGLKRGHGPAPRPSLLVATHMDAIGLMVTSQVDGFLHITGIGGVDGRVLPGARVTVHGRRDLPGVVAQPSARLLPPEVGANDAVPLEHLLVDTGLPARTLAGLVRVGDLVSFANPPAELSGGTLAGHSLDNRASVAALTVCLEELQTRPLQWDVAAVATVQEETGLIGAATSAFQLQPALALVVDVTWAKGPGASDWNTLPLDKGPSLLMGPNIHPALYQAVRAVADRLELPYSLEYTSGNSGTDAVAVQATAEGIPTLVLGIPLRYMHTPVELVSLRDIQRAGRLMAEFLSGLAPDFLDQITWDD